MGICSSKDSNSNFLPLARSDADAQKKIYLYLQELKYFDLTIVNNFEIRALQFFIFGPMSSGKSTLISTGYSHLSGQINDMIAISGRGNRSTTSQIRSIQLPQISHKIELIDSFGINDVGYYKEFFPYALDGYIDSGFEENCRNFPQREIIEIKSRKMHGILFLFDPSTLEMTDRVRDIQEILSIAKSRNKYAPQAKTKDLLKSKKVIEIMTRVYESFKGICSDYSYYYPAKNDRINLKDYHQCLNFIKPIRDLAFKAVQSIQAIYREIVFYQSAYPLKKFKLGSIITDQQSTLYLDGIRKTIIKKDMIAGNFFFMKQNLQDKQFYQVSLNEESRTNIKDLRIDNISDANSTTTWCILIHVMNDSVIQRFAPGRE